MTKTKNHGSAVTDRVSGVLVGAAVGDALGAGYEFGAAPYGGWPQMIGGGLGGFAPGEWTDDTDQAMAIARVAATGADLRSPAALDAIAAGFAEWMATGPSDVGIQTSQVLSGAGRHADAATMAAAARAVHERSGRSAGNGSLMRTAPVALAHLDDPAALVEAAMAVSALTHHDPIAGEGAALWCLMIRHAVLMGEFPTIDEALADHPAPGRWREILAEAEAKPPATFTTNGWVVGALQAAWSAIVHSPVPERMPCRHFQDALATAIGIGHDTDTVAAIAGALLGARWGVSAIPQEWSSVVHGWPAATTADLVELALLTVRGGPDGSWPDTDRMDYRSWSGVDAFAPHPSVPGVWIGGAAALDDLPRDIDAVVSLCRVGRRQVPGHVRSHVVRLLDTRADDNPNLDFAVDDAARTVLRLVDEGSRVYLHCVAAQSRTPTVAARVAALSGMSTYDAMAAVRTALPDADPQGFFLAALERLGGDPEVSVVTPIVTNEDEGGAR